MARTRTGLARLAIRQARREGWIARDAPVSLVGDSPADVKAAHGSKARAIAVATGLTPAADLAATGPDFLLRNLRELRLRMVEGK
jgi:phosphoglycolate phosphatase-like HAD superfamily hydrolase